MRKLTDYITYADAQAHCTSEALWALFDGDREHFNIAHECVDRHAASGRIISASAQSASSVPVVVIVAPTS